MQQLKVGGDVKLSLLWLFHQPLPAVCLVYIVTFSKIYQLSGIGFDILFWNNLGNQNN